MDEQVRDFALRPRIEGESKRAYRALLDYCQMGSGRSLRKLLDVYLQQASSDTPTEPPTTRFNTLTTWSNKNKWVEAADAWDRRLADQEQAEIEAAWREKIMGPVEVLGRMSEHGRNDMGQYFKVTKRWTEDPLPSEEILDEEQYEVEIRPGLRVQRTRYLVKKVVLDMDAFLDPGRSRRIKKFTDSPKSGLSIELYDAHGAQADIGKHHKLFTNSDDRSAQVTEAFALPARCIAPSFLDVYDDIQVHGHTEYVFKGGRGSTKSSFISLAIVELLINNPTMHAIALRQVANTLRDSVYSQLEWAINELGLTDQFKCTVSPLEIEYRPTGQKIYFRGADEPGKIKSIKPAFGHIGIAWFEELDQFKGPEAVRNIEQSAIRGGDLAYIFKSFNPPRTQASWANKYVQIPKANQYVHHSTYLELGSRVRWLGRPWVEEAEHLKAVNPAAYEHEYMGVANGTGGMVFENVQIRTITDDEIKEFDRVLQGLDFGWFPDPLHWGRCHYDAGRMTLYIFDELRANKMSNRELHKALTETKGVTPDELITADSAEPKSIGDLRDFGLMVRPAEKGPESVNYSMKWLQSLAAIVIDPERCPYAAEEFLNYELEPDPNEEGSFISEYPDKNNHAIDMARYATNRIWKRRGQ